MRGVSRTNYTASERRIIMSNSKLVNFARRFFHTRNAFEAAVAAGVPPEKAALGADSMLEQPAARKELERLEKSSPQTLSYVRTGLTRLAFGQVNDAVRLAFDKEVTAEQIMKMDLFNISGIKLQKDGAVEIKFADRQTALEKLVELDPELKVVSDADKLISMIYGGSGSDSNDDG